jgi:hypothetical protein
MPSRYVTLNTLNNRFFVKYSEDDCLSIQNADVRCHEALAGKKKLTLDTTPDSTKQPLTFSLDSTFVQNDADGNRVCLGVFHVI